MWIFVCWRIKRKEVEKEQRKDDCSYAYSETTLVQEGANEYVEVLSWICRMNHHFRKISSWTFFPSLCLERRGFFLFLFFHLLNWLMSHKNENYISSIILLVKKSWPKLFWHKQIWLTAYFSTLFLCKKKWQRGKIMQGWVFSLQAYVNHINSSAS